MDAHHLDVPACAELAIAYPVQHDCSVFRGPSAGTNDRPLAVLGTVCDFRPWRLPGTYGVGCGGSGRHRLADGSLWGFWSLIWPVCIIAGGISPYRRRYPLHVDLDGGELRLAVRGRWRGVAGACRRLCSGWNTHMAAGGWCAGVAR